MTIAILLVTLVAVGLLVAHHRGLDARLDAISRSLARIENALGAEEWTELLKEEASMPQDNVERNAIAARLDRIEVAVDPTARARQDVKRVMCELDDALKEDSSNGYAHWQVSKIEELVEKGERPRREDWESWIGTPFPWSD